MLPAALNNKDIFFNASVAELRRKAQEHSEALLKNIQSQHQKNSDESLKTNETIDTSLDDFRSNLPGVGIINGKIIPNSSLDIEKIACSSSAVKTDSVPGIPSIDIPKFPPNNYLSALSNFGFHGLPNLPDINPQPPGLHPRFATNLANLMDKTSNDVNLKNIDDLIGINSSRNKSMSPGLEDTNSVSASDTKLKSPKTTASS